MSNQEAKLRIMLVEDEGVIAADIESHLREAGYEITAIAGSGEEALSQIAKDIPDLILLDIRIRGEIDGFETARRIQQKFDIPVVYVTARSGETSLRRKKLAEPMAYLSKPFDGENLPLTIEVAIQKHSLEREIRRQRAWLASLVGSIADGIVATDHLGSVQFLNPVAESLTGWQLDDAKNQPLTSVVTLMAAENKHIVGRFLLDALKKSESMRLPEGLHLASRNGRVFPIEGEMAPCHDAAGVLGAVLTLRDATGRQKREEELRHQHKLQAVGRLAGGIAHDFNNALTIILGSAELMRADIPPDSPLVQPLLEIANAATMAADVTRRLLAFTRKQAIRPNPLDVNELIRDNEGFCRTLLMGTHIELKFDLASKLPQIVGDPAQIQQILLNLVTNARDAMPEGGLLEVATGRVELPGVGFGESKVEYAVLSVRDEGLGMDPEVAKRMFDPFFTTKSAGHGTGLGLSIVDNIVNSFGGTITVNSKLGVGTDFDVFLPVQPLMHSGKLRSNAAGAPLTSGPETILLVDDDQAVRSVMRAYFHDTDYEVIEASDPIDALSLASTHKGPIHLLITDVMLPKMTGFKLAQQIAPLRPDIKTIFVSGYAGELVDRDLLPAGTCFLHKPFGQREFMSLVREMIDPELSASKQA